MPIEKDGYSSSDDYNKSPKAHPKLPIKASKKQPETLSLEEMVSIRKKLKAEFVEMSKKYKDSRSESLGKSISQVKKQLRKMDERILNVERIPNDVEIKTFIQETENFKEKIHDTTQKARRRTLLDHRPNTYEALTLDRKKNNVKFSASQSHSHPLTKRPSKKEVAKTCSLKNNTSYDDENFKEIEDFENFSKSMLAKIERKRPKNSSLDAGVGLDRNKALMSRVSKISGNSQREQLV